MIMGWPIIASAAVLLYLRWQPVDRVYLIAAVALTPYLAVPLVPATAMAWFSRSLPLRAVTALVVAAYLFTVSPLDAVIGCRAERSERPITIMTANVYVEGGDPESFANQVRTVNPDILIMQESNSGFLSVFDVQPELDPWPYRSHLEPEPVRGVVVWSKWPMSNVEFGALGLYQSVAATVAMPDGDVRLKAVHTTSPTDWQSVDTWYEEFDRLAEYSIDGPTIMAGDFNATEDHAPFRKLLAAGWTDVHDDKGCGLDQTWPTQTLPFPVMRLDHVLVSDAHFRVLSTEIVEIAGSDHLSVVTAVELVDQPGRVR
jgi:endonuclease/exonuclease/phosphatase (EEP) superfamily protein YafD